MSNSEFVTPKRKRSLNLNRKVDSIEEYIQKKINNYEESLRKGIESRKLIINNLVKKINKSQTSNSASWSSDYENYNGDEIFNIIKDNFINEMKDKGFHAQFSFSSKRTPIDVYGDTGIEYIITLHLTNISSD